MNIILFLQLFFLVAGERFAGDNYFIAASWNLATAKSIMHLSKSKRLPYMDNQKILDLMRFKKGSNSKLYQSEIDLRASFIGVLKGNILIDKLTNYVIVEQNIESETLIHTASLIVNDSEVYKVYSFDYTGKWHFKDVKSFTLSDYNMLINSRIDYQKSNYPGELIISFFGNGGKTIQSIFIPNKSVFSNSPILSYITAAYSKPVRIFIGNQ